MEHKVCTFFGHRDTPESVRPLLHDTLTGIIERREADEFLVGNEGNFDRMVRAELAALVKIYPHIRYMVVLAYMPGQKADSRDDGDFADTVYPDGLETAPPRFAIDRRNRIMLSRADIVVTYVRFLGGASRFRDLALRREKTVIDLATGE